jgi:copper oxidase (laccase) domain-containing protein
MGHDLSDEVLRNRMNFLRKNAMPFERVAVPYVRYEGDDYCRYRQAQAGKIIEADALSTNELNIPILLPLADCTGAILYDPEHHALMVSHLGRHSTEQMGALRSVEYMTRQYGTNPRDLLVWLSPSPNGIDYPLWAFNNRSFTDVLTEQLIQSGVQQDHIESSGIDTVSSADYFSHSEFLKGNRPIDGRYAIVAMLSSSL